MDREDLLKLIEDDDLGLLKLDPEKPKPVTEKDRLIASFHEINNFVSQHGHEPRSVNDIQERKLHARLEGIRKNYNKISILRDFDMHGLLNTVIKELSNIEDVFDDDDLGILDDDHNEIFKIKHIPQNKLAPDYIAIRKPCSDFEKFQNKFIQCQSDLTAGMRKQIPFRCEQTIDQGHFYALKGVLVYVADIGKREINGVRINPRLRCIFDNGMESDLLLHSLAAALYKDGCRITDYLNHDHAVINDTIHEDKQAGYIYVLKSHSDNQKIKQLKDLYKIAFSTLPVEERIKSAASDPTYLMAEVSVIAIYQCYNIKIHKFESLLQSFFASSCLSMDVYDKQGQRHTPREWFIAPLNIIDQAIQLLLNGTIVNYYYDPISKIIVSK